MAKKRIVFDSRNKVDEDTHPYHDFESGTYVLESFSLTNNLYNVNDNNKYLYISYFDGVNYTNYTITLTKGIYSAVDIVTMIDTQLTASVGAWTVTYSSLTGKITITETTGGAETFIIKTGDSSANSLIGFKDEDQTTYANAQTSDYPVDLIPVKGIFISIDQAQKIYDGHGYFTATFYVPITSGFGERLVFPSGDHICRQELTIQRSNRFKITFHDSKKKTIDLNGAEWVLILNKIN